MTDLRTFDSQTAAILQAFRSECDDLPFDADSLSDFNARIQIEIETADQAMHTSRAVALALAQIKFIANQKFDRLRREHGKAAS